MMNRDASLGDHVLWALTKTSWWTATAGVALALISAHQGVHGA